MTTVVINSDADDGYLYKSGLDYNTIRTAALAYQIVIGPPCEPLSIGQKTAYEIYRTGIFFDTSSISIYSIIDSAKLTFVLIWDGSDTDFDIVIQNGQPTYPHKPMETLDYDYTLYSGNGGSINTSLLPPNDYPFDIDLNATGLTWINKGGTTKLMLRSSREINGDVPTGFELVQLYSFDCGIPYIPTLTIDYHIQPSKKLHISSSNENIYNIESKNEHNLNIMKRER